MRRPIIPTCWPLGHACLALALSALLACGGASGGSTGTSGPVGPQPPGVDYTPSAPRLAKDPLVEDLRAISDPAMGGRPMGSPGNAAARALLVQRFQSLGLSAFDGAFERPFTSPRGPGVNVVGYLAGTQHPSQAILVTAHYDHIGTRNGQVVCGADDNASGTAAVLALAAYFKAHPPAHTVLFCLFDGEELGLLGAEAFAAAPPAPWTLPQVMLVVNVDMIAQGTEGRIFVGGTSIPAQASTRSFLKTTVLDAFATTKVRAVPDYEQYDAYSDQGPFQDRGVPFLFFCVGDDDPYYHTVYDTFDRIPKVFYWAVVEGVLDTLLRLDATAALPQFVPRPPTKALPAFARTYTVHPWSRRLRD